MEILWMVFALIAIIIILGVFLIMAAIAGIIVFDSTGNDNEKYKMDDETFEHIKQAQMLQMNNLFGNYL